MNRTVRGWMAIAAAVVMSAALASRVAAQVEADTTVAVGLTFEDPQIAEAIDLFEKGKREEAFQRLTDLIRDPARNEKQRVLELRAAQSMLQIRDGDAKLRGNANATLGNMVNGETDLARRAQVIKLMGDDRIKDGTRDIADLKPRENWLERMRIVRTHLQTKLDEKTTEMEDAAGRDKGHARINTVMKDRESPCHYVYQMKAIKVQSADTSAAITSYASRLRGVFASINSQIRQCKAELQPLHAAWAGEHNRARKADRRDDYNKVQNQAKQWHDVGKLVQKHYQEMVSRQLGIPPLGQPLEDCPIRLK